jgi:sugar/nucleoside kinase (ribokinase family)
MKGMAVRAMSFGDDRRSLVPKFPASAKAGTKNRERIAVTEIRSENSATVVALGEIVVEIIARDAGQSLGKPGVLLGPYPSGAPAIFIDQVAKLDCGTGLIAAVGDDVFGQLNIERLKNDGVDVSAISVLPGETTGSAFVSYRLDGERDFVFNIRNGACGRLAPENANLAILEHCRHLHVMGSSLISEPVIALTLEAIRIVRRRQGTVSFDPNIRKELLTEKMMTALKMILSWTDIYLPGRSEVTLLSSCQDVNGAIAEYLETGVKEVAVKLGSGGAEIHTAEGIITQAAFPVEEADPTGAGDCFGGAYIACRTLGCDIRQASYIAAVCGARAVTKKGPMEGTSTWAEIKRFLVQTGVEFPHELSTFLQ